MVSKKNLAIIGGAVALVIVLLFVVLDLYIAGVVSQIKPTPPVTGPIDVLGVITARGIATYNNGAQLVEYGQVGYSMINATSANISISTYTEDPVFRVYLVNAGANCYKCLNRTALYAALESDLSVGGLVHNATSLVNVTLDNLSTIEPNSMVVFATGLLPAAALPDTGLARTPGESNVTILSLMHQGDYIFYIGNNFSDMMQDGFIYQTPNTTTDALELNNIFVVNHLNQTQSALNVSAETFHFAPGGRMGPVVYVHPYNRVNGYKNATLMAITVPPEVAWKNASIAAGDISKVIEMRFWIPLLAYGTYALNATNWQPTGNFTVFTTDQPMENGPYATSIINNSYGVIHLQVSNDRASQGAEIPFTLRYQSNSTLALPSVVGYGNTEPLNLSVNTHSSTLSFVIYVYDRNLRFAYANPIGAFNTSLPILKYGTFGNIQTGAYYLATLVDINGRHYGTALFYVPNLNITLIKGDPKNETFLFNVQSFGQPLVNGTYTININGAYNETGSVQNGVLDYALPKGAILNYGQQVIRIRLVGHDYLQYLFYQQPQGIPALYIEFGVAAMVILLLNFILRAPNREEYYIDVPELPPVKKTEFTLGSDAIVGLFETINYHYHWKYMPLTPDEIKSGISTNIRVGNTPLSVTLQNTNEILYQLSNSGQLLTKNEYYMPKKWADASKHDIEYLIIFRRLRDFLVEHAAFFTDLDAGGEADMLITARSKQVPVFIYSTVSGIRNMPVRQGHKTFIVFISSDVLEDFQDRLYKTSGVKAERMRLAIETGIVELIDTERLEGLLY